MYKKISLFLGDVCKRIKELTCYNICDLFSDGSAKKKKNRIDWSITRDKTKAKLVGEYRWKVCGYWYYYS